VNFAKGLIGREMREDQYSFFGLRYRQDRNAAGGLKVAPRLILASSANWIFVQQQRTKARTGFAWHTVRVSDRSLPMPHLRALLKR